MKCPKCGYNSFESYDVCKKCSFDLTTHKATYGLKPLVFQDETLAAMAAALATETVAAVAPEAPAPEQATDLFTFDLPGEETTAPAREQAQTVKEDVFSFDEQPAAPPREPPSPFSFDMDQPSLTKKPVEDVFADLLETTEHKGAGSTPPSTPATPSASGPGEYDLSHFSWDDTPEPTESGKKKPADDFSSLFGEIEDTTKKK